MTRRRSQSGRQPVATQSTGESLAIDLAYLRDMHPRLPGDMAGLMVVRAALGLQRNKHSSGANLQMDIESMGLSCTLIWPAADLGTAEQHDYKRITEDGAEAIALAVAHETKAWGVVRRMQQGEHADWLLEHRDNGVRKLVALEVSGTDKRSITGPLHEKLTQVARSIDVNQRCAGIVGFKQPKATLQSVKVRTRGH